MNVQPVTLSGTQVRLEPLLLEHVQELAGIGLDPGLWRWQPSVLSSVEDMRVYVSAALDQQQRGSGLPFVIVDQGTQSIIGTTRFFDITRKHRRLEIGATWLARTHQRTGANTEAKFLLLTHAFDTLEAIRVVFKTEASNEVSRRAITRIGAVEEGTFRRHLIAASGRQRDMVYYSILDTEWPAVKARLLALRVAATSRRPR